jgi:hypothetical protein
MAEQARRIDEVLAGLAEELGLERLALDEDDQCLVDVDGQIVLMQYISEAEIVVMQIDLGPISGRAELAVLRALMTANTSWRESGGGAFGLAPEAVHAVLTARLDLAELTADSFTDRVGDLADAAARWSAHIAALTASIEAAAPEDLGLRIGAGIRA